MGENFLPFDVGRLTMASRASRSDSSVTLAWQEADILYRVVCELRNAYSALRSIGHFDLIPEDHVLAMQYIAKGEECEILKILKHLSDSCLPITEIEGEDDDI